MIVQNARRKPGSLVGRSEPAGDNPVARDCTNDVQDEGGAKLVEINTLKAHGVAVNESVL